MEVKVLKNKVLYNGCLHDKGDIIEIDDNLYNQEVFEDLNPMDDDVNYHKMTVPDLKKLASEMGIEKYHNMNKNQLIAEITAVDKGPDTEYMGD